MTYKAIVLRKLQEKGTITHNEICRITNTNCPYSVIRDLRNENYNITDEWEIKTREEIGEDGKKRKVVKRFKRFFLQAA